MSGWTQDFEKYKQDREKVHADESTNNLENKEAEDNEEQIANEFQEPVDTVKKVSILMADFIWKN